MDNNKIDRTAIATLLTALVGLALIILFVVIYK